MRAELAAYGAGLETRPEIVVLNKLDLLARPDGAEGGRRARCARAAARSTSLSGATGEGVAELLAAFARALGDEAER